MNQTIIKFGYPATLVRDYEHWVVLLRPAQPTLGSLVLAAKSDATAFGDLPPAAYIEMGVVISDIEAMLKRAVSFEKINYLMLMMNDPNVHCHVIPRYEGSRTAHGLTVVDAGWPRPPALQEALTLSETEIETLVGWLKESAA